MADLHVVEFALIPGLLRKEIQVDDFSQIDISQTSHSVFGFPAFFGVFTLRTDPQNILHNEGDARNNSTFPLSEVEITAH